jgi:hypothetical protein
MEKVEGKKIEFVIDHTLGLQVRHSESWLAKYPDHCEAALSHTQ